MSQVHFSVVSALLYPFALLVAASGLALWLSQYRAYRDIVLHGSRAHWLRDGLVGGLALVLVSFLSFRPLPHLLTVFGFLSGLRAAGVASTVLGLAMLATGWPVPCVILTWIAGPLGGLLHSRGPTGRLITILSASLWPPICWLEGWMPEVFQWHLRLLSTTSMAWMIGAISVVSMLHSWLLLSLLEYFAQREARRMGESLWKLAALLDPVLDAARSSPPNEALCRAMEAAVEAPCFGLPLEHTLLHHQAFPRLEPTPKAMEALTKQEPFIADSLDIFTHLDQDFPATTVIFPLHDGDRTFGALFVPVSDSHPLAGSDPSMRKALGALLSGELNSQRLLRQQAVLDETHYRMLAAQIQPHFLFNSLTSVAALTLSQPEAAHDLIVDLAHSLRPRFAPGSEWVTLAEELETVRSYMAVEKARFGDKLQLETVMPKELARYLVPPMLLQPIVENAVRHGLGPRGGEGSISIIIKPDDAYLHIQIKDNGVGFSHRHHSDGHGVGLSNVRERLQALFGDDHQFRLNSVPEVGCDISYRLPRLPAKPPRAAGAAAVAPLARPVAGVVSGVDSRAPR